VKASRAGREREREEWLEITGIMQAKEAEKLHIKQQT
jgi:hypothetical protein